LTHRGANLFGTFPKKENEIITCVFRAQVVTSWPMARPTHFKMVFAGADVFTVETCAQCGKLHPTKVNHYLGSEKPEVMERQRAKLLGEGKEELPKDLCQCEREEPEEVEEEDEDEENN
jgi:hypothetical protein